MALLSLAARRAARLGAVAAATGAGLEAVSVLLPRLGDELDRGAPRLRWSLEGPSLGVEVDVDPSQRERDLGIALDVGVAPTPLAAVLERPTAATTFALDEEVGGVAVTVSARGPQRARDEALLWTAAGAGDAARAALRERLSFLAGGGDRIDTMAVTVRRSGAEVRAGVEVATAGPRVAADLLARIATMAADVGVTEPQRKLIEGVLEPLARGRIIRLVVGASGGGTLAELGLELSSQPWAVVSRVVAGFARDGASQVDALSAASDVVEVSELSLTLRGVEPPRVRVTLPLEP